MCLKRIYTRTPNEQQIKMGFYINIHACVPMCPDVGKMYYYINDEKVYGVPPITVPIEHRRFLNEKNRIYHSYLDQFGQDKCFEDVDNLLNSFPSWEAIKTEFPHVEIDYNWTVSDHLAFQVALEWFSNQNVRFIIMWG